MPHVVHNCPALAETNGKTDAKFPGEGFPLLSENHQYCPNCGQPTADMEPATPEQANYLQGGREVNFPGVAAHKQMQERYGATRSKEAKEKSTTKKAARTGTDTAVETETETTETTK